MNHQNLLKTAVISALTLGAASIATAAPSGAGADTGGAKMVKCYGINAAHKNDCQSGEHSCAGTEPKARAATAFVEVPAGLCAKIAGGSLTPKTQS